MHRVINERCFAVFLLLVGASVTASEPQPLEKASIVISGKVRRIYHDEPPAQETVVTYLIEVVVEKVERAKPEGILKPGKILLAETYRTRKVPGKFPPAGELAVVKPEQGDFIRVYCYQREDGGYQVLMNARAIQKLDLPKK